MFACVRRLVLVLLVVLLPRVAQAQSSQQAQPVCDAVIPANVDARLLAGDMLTLLRRSETFREQCERVAAEPRLHVTVEIAYALDGGRAQTAFRRYESGAWSAEVVVLFGENYRELLGHEFEHIIEQIEGVNLRQATVQGLAWRLAGGAFETRRAFATGVQVRREVEASHVRAVAAVASTR